MVSAARPGNPSGKPLLLERSSCSGQCSSSSRDPVVGRGSASQHKDHICLCVDGFPRGPAGLGSEKAVTLLLVALEKGIGEPAKVGVLPCANVHPATCQRNGSASQKRGQCSPCKGRLFFTLNRCLKTGGMLSSETPGNLPLLS